MTDMTETPTQALTRVVAPLEATKATILREQFGAMFTAVEGWQAEAKHLIVTAEDQSGKMTRARSLRLEIKHARVEMDKRRKAMKAGIVVEGRAIDGAYAIFAALAEPLERYLQEQETFAERAQAARIDALRDSRAEALRALGSTVIPEVLGAISEEAWQAMLADAKLARAERERIAREEEAARIETQRILTEQRAAAEKERVRQEAERRAREEEQRRENERLRKEAAAERARVAEERRIEREAAQRIEAAAQAEAEEARRALAAAKAKEAARTAHEEGARRMRTAPLDAAWFDAVAAWSRQTFGPGERRGGLLSHLRKELCEIETDPGDLMEWIDVALLAFDGAARCGHATGEQVIAALREKAETNRARQWPDWRARSEDEAIEHEREDA